TSFSPTTTLTSLLYTLSLHDALPIFTGTTDSMTPSSIPRHASIHPRAKSRFSSPSPRTGGPSSIRSSTPASIPSRKRCVHLSIRSEEHTSELQSLAYLVCRLLLEKKK